MCCDVYIIGFLRVGAVGGTGRPLVLRIVLFFVIMKCLKHMNKLLSNLMSVIGSVRTSRNASMLVML